MSHWRFFVVAYFMPESLSAARTAAEGAGYEFKPSPSTAPGRQGQYSALIMASEQECPALREILLGAGAIEAKTDSILPLGHLFRGIHDDEEAKRRVSEVVENFRKDRTFWHKDAPGLS